MLSAIAPFPKAKIFATAIAAPSGSIVTVEPMPLGTLSEEIMSAPPNFSL